MRKLLLVVAGLIMFIPFAVNANEWRATDGGACYTGGTVGTQITCVFHATNPSTPWNGVLTYGAGAEIVSVTPQTGWGWTSTAPNLTLPSIPIQLTRSGPQQSGLVPLVSVTWRILAEEDCFVRMNQTQTPPPPQDCPDDCPMGTPYNPPHTDHCPEHCIVRPDCPEDCPMGTPHNPPHTDHCPEHCLVIDNPETGAFIPYILVAAGAITAIGIYLALGKRSRFYKI